MANFIAFGDSITQGVPAHLVPHNGALNIGGYIPELKLLLDAENGADNNFYNWGAGGNTSALAVSRLSTAINAQSADYIIIMIGVNDARLSMSSDDMKSNIQAMIDQSQAAGLSVILGQITPHTAVINTNIENDYQLKIHELKTENNLPLATTYDDLIGGWESAPYHSGDSLHMASSGNAVLAQAFFGAINLALINFQIPLGDVFMTKVESFLNCILDCLKISYDQESLLVVNDGVVVFNANEYHSVSLSVSGAGAVITTGADASVSVPSGFTTSFDATTFLSESITVQADANTNVFVSWIK